MTDPVFHPPAEFEGTIYDIATGAVLGHFTRAADTLDQIVLDPGMAMIAGHVPADRLVDHGTGADEARDSWSPVAGINEVSGVPDGTRALVGDRWATVANGKVRIAADWPETVEVWLQHPRHGELTLKVQCEPLTGKAAPGAVRLAQDVGLLRAGAYLPVGDQLDLIIKGLKKLPGASAVPELKALIDASDAVKATFPKG